MSQLLYVHVYTQCFDYNYRPSFSLQALIVSEAYRHCIHADWVNTIYKRRSWLKETSSEITAATIIQFPVHNSLWIVFRPSCCLCVCFIFSDTCLTSSHLTPLPPPWCRICATSESFCSLYIII